MGFLSAPEESHPAGGVRAAPVPTVRRVQVVVRKLDGRRPESQVRPSDGSTAASMNLVMYVSSAS